MTDTLQLGPPLPGVRRIGCACGEPASSTGLSDIVQVRLKALMFGLLPGACIVLGAKPIDNIEPDAYNQC